MALAAAYYNVIVEIYADICNSSHVCVILSLILINVIKQLSSMRLLAVWASYQIRKIASCACAGNAGNVSPCGPLQRKPLVSDPGMHHGTCMMHVPWCMSGSLTRGGGENVPGIPGACAPAILRIWQEAHVVEGVAGSYIRRWHESDMAESFDTDFVIGAKLFAVIHQKSLR